MLFVFVVYVCTGVQQSVETQISDTTTEQQKDCTQDDDHHDDLVWKHSDMLLLIETFRKYWPNCKVDEEEERNLGDGGISHERRPEKQQIHGG